MGARLAQAFPTKRRTSFGHAEAAECVVVLGVDENFSGRAGHRSMTTDITHLLLNFADCSYKALLAKRNEPSEITEFHRLENQQQLAHVNQELEATYKPTQVLRNPVSLSRSLRTCHRLILDATCQLAGKTIALPPIEVSEAEKTNALVDPRLLHQLQRSGQLAACAFTLLIGPVVAELSPGSGKSA